MVLRGVSQQQTIPAGQLRKRGSVLCANGVKALERVDHFLSDADAFESMLEPDAEMEICFIEDDHTPALLTKGKRINQSGIANRRGGMHKRCQF